METLKKIEKMAKNKQATIVLPEANIDERVRFACEKILKKKLAKIIVLGKVEEFSKVFSSSDCQIIDNENEELLKQFSTELYHLRKHKGLKLAEAKKLVKQPLYFAMMLVKLGYADGVVAGAANSTANVLRPALQIIKTKPNKNIVTGSMLMLKKNEKPLLFGDVALIEQPAIDELAEIAVANAEFMQNVLGETAKVAMLSYSTKGSAKNEMTEKVANATNLAKESGYLIDGEMQVDSALDVATASKKGVTSEVGGNANVLIFPDLNAGNIGYKLASRLGKYNAVGPIMLNFNNPVNDLSRGCTVEEIVQTVLITKLLV